MYNIICNPITRQELDIYSDLGKATLSNFINYYQNGGKPCTNCGKRRHNRRTCRASGAKYWRKLPEKERNRLIRKNRISKKFTRGYMAKNTIKIKDDPNNHIGPDEIKENKFSINKDTDFYIFKKTKFPEEFKALFNDIYKDILSMFIKIEDKDGNIRYVKSLQIDENRINIEIGKDDEYIINQNVDLKELKNDEVLNILFSERQIKNLSKKIGKLSTDLDTVSLVVKHNTMLVWNISDVMNTEYVIPEIYSDINFIKFQEYISFIIDKSDPENHKVIGTVEAYNMYNQLILYSEGELNITEDNRSEWFEDPNKLKILKKQIVKNTYEDFEINDFGDEIPNKPLYYISAVGVHPDYRGKKMLFNDKGTEFVGGVCKPLVGHMVSHLKNLYPESKLLIFNASNTKEGIPACYCYYTAGIDNGYKMKYLTEAKEKRFEEMPDDWCSKCGISKDKLYDCKGEYLYDLE